MWEDYLETVKYAPCPECGEYETMVLDERKETAICGNCDCEFSFKEFMEEMGYLWEDGLCTLSEDEKDEVFDSYF